MFDLEQSIPMHKTPTTKQQMKKILVPTAAALTSMLLLTGCIIVAKDNGNRPTVGQQLIDLQKAKNAGAITDGEYQMKKAKILDGKLDDK